MAGLTRRDFGRRMGNFLAAAALSGVGLSTPLKAEAREREFDVSYLWTADLEGALDYMEEVGRVLGPELRRELRLVRGNSGNYGVIYDRRGSKAQALFTAGRHSAVLEGEELEPAAIVEREGYHELFNISYGLGPNLAELREDFRKVAAVLGPEVARNLIIEQTPSGNYALVYKRWKDMKSVDEIARQQALLLRQVGIRVSVIRENNNEQVYGASSHLNEIVEQERPEKGKAHPKPVESRPSTSTDLESQVEELIGRLRRAGRIEADETTSWSVYDFTSGEKLVSINEDVPRQCASMVKPLVALAFFHLVKEGRLSYGPRSTAKMEAMIQRSNNGATNWVMRQVGGPERVNRILQEHYGHLLRDTRIVEYIPSGGRTYRNKASAHDYSRFLHALWEGELPYAKELRRLMALPNRDRVYTGASEVPSDTLVIDKTGSTRKLCGDMAILGAKGKDGKRYPYSLVGIIEKRAGTSHYGSWIARRGKVIREASNKVYSYMKERHNLR